MKIIKLNKERFNAALSMMGSPKSSKSSQVCRLVLCEGLTIAEASKMVAVTYKAAHIAVTRFNSYIERCYVVADKGME